MKVSPLILVPCFAAAIIAGCELTRTSESTPLAPPRAVPFFGLARSESTPLPATLSATGVFADVREMTPNPSLIPYDISVSFYSDHADKIRYFALPAGEAGRAAEKIHFASAGPWRFPAGSVFVKTFQLPRENAPPLRIETRLLFRDEREGVFGGTYRWRADNSDADLVSTSTTAPLDSGHSWYFPSPKDCRTCHTPASSGVLGLNTRQLNRTHGGRNQIATYSAWGLFDATPPAPAALPALAPLADATAPLETRIRSYLDANCAHCHQPGATGDFDARFGVPLDVARLAATPVRISMGVDHARLVAPKDPWRSAMLGRIDTMETTRMPPLGRQTIDAEAVSAFREWIAAMPGTDVLPPPTIGSPGNSVVLSHADAAATIRYTLDGSLPRPDSPVYREPIPITSPTVVRAAAFKAGAMRSITVQEVLSGRGAERR